MSQLSSLPQPLARHVGLDNTDLLMAGVLNSCRNRHCPKCQSLAKAEWLEARMAELLPVPYYDVVFTVPDEVSAVAFQNTRVLYRILFRAASETLHTIAADPKHLGAELGFLAVLHTWTQTLLQNPHS